MGTQPMATVVVSALGRLSRVNTVVSRAGTSLRSAIGICKEIPGNRTDPLGRGRMGRDWDFL